MAGVFGVGVNSPLNQMLREQFLTPRQAQQITEQEQAQTGGGLLPLLLSGTAAGASVAAANAATVPNAREQILGEIFQQARQRETTDPGALAGGPPVVTTPVPTAAPITRRSNEGSFFDRVLSTGRQGSVARAFGEGLFGRGRAQRQIRAEELALAAARTQVEGTQALIRQREAQAQKALADAQRAGRTAQSPAGKLRADQEAKIITKETADAGIAKINEIGESAFDEKVEALVGTGLDRDTAINIVSGRFVTSRDPTRGTAQVIDKATGQVVGGATPEIAAAIDAVQSPQEPNIIGLATGPIDTTAAAFSGLPIIGEIMEEIGFGGADQRKARIAIESLGKSLEIAFANNPRFAEGEMKRIQSLKPKVGFFSRESSTFADLQQLRSEMADRLVEETGIANDPALAPSVKKEAQQAVAHLPGVIRKIDKMLAASRFSVEGKPIPNMTSGDLDSVADRVESGELQLSPEQINMLAAQERRLSGQ